ncbi:MAG: hypothetical protein HGA86_06010, partial [Anaerolineaceae bacterium]|nr:hypothetical protein [Anaerolineaceae bacterium]
MKQSRLTIFVFALIFLFSLALTACGSTATAVPTQAPTEASAPIMTVVGPDGERAFSMDELKALPVSEGQGGIKSSTGKITIPQLFKGVSIKDLIAAQGVKFDESMGVTLFAEDGYSITFSYDQVMNGNFIAYDPSNGNEMKTHDPLTAIIAYEQGGKALDPRTDGNLRLAVISTKNNQVVDGHWAVKWVNKL